MRSLKNNTKIAPVQEHFLSSVQRVAVELIREKERGNIKAVKLPCQRAIASVLFPLTFYSLCQTTGCPQISGLRDSTVFKELRNACSLRRWKNCARLWPGMGGEGVFVFSRLSSDLPPEFSLMMLWKAGMQTAYLYQIKENQEGQCCNQWLWSVSADSQSADSQTRCCWGIWASASLNLFIFKSILSAHFPLSWKHLSTSLGTWKYN